jgi:DNA-binding NarL/FixJ family response regulator
MAAPSQRFLSDAYRQTGTPYAGFDSLMPHRAHDILVVASDYDAFVIEEGGRLTELILGEFVSLNLHTAPSITRVATAEQALELLHQRRFDLVLTMLWAGEVDAFTFGRRVKSIDPRVPVVVLAFDTRELARLQPVSPRDGVDETFIWWGDARLFMAILKLFEDRWNADHDARVASVRTILLIEDSVRFTSLYLPLLYTELMDQTQSLMDEGVNVTHRVLRMRARPKILLARSYEQAVELYARYRPYMLGVICDLSFPREGKVDPGAGATFVRRVKEDDPTLPVLLQSSEDRAAQLAEQLGASFIHKRSRSLLADLRRFIQGRLGFGDFVFLLPDGATGVEGATEVDRASDLRSMEETLARVPDASLLWHANRNDFSNWLRARTEFELAARLRPRRVSEFSSIGDLRAYLIRTLSAHRAETRRGVVADYSPRQFDAGSAFVRIGRGSLGGKGRGLAFANHLLLRSGIAELFDGVRIAVPPTAVIGTDVFDALLDDVRLREIAYGSALDEEITRAFLAARLPEDVREDLATFLERVTYPLAVRSSSLLEDSQLQPFAGIYRTYMLPNNHPRREVRLRQLERAVKLVYASTFSLASRAYIESTPYRMEDEKMAVVLQQLVGSAYGTRFYPTLSGVIRSYNFYPIAPLRAEDGIAVLALGFGRQVVLGFDALRFSPVHPHHFAQFATVADTVRNSQHHFFALDLSHPDAMSDVAEDSNMLRLGLPAALADGTMTWLASTYSPQNDCVYDGLREDGTPLVTFSPILKSEAYPLAEILRTLEALARDGLGAPVEIEFAMDLTRQPAFFGFLQTRRMVIGREPDEAPLEEDALRRPVCLSLSALGNGTLPNIHDIVYVRPEQFDPSRTPQIAGEVGRINAQLRAEKRPYVLIGPGRWGSADPWLGIPVGWEQISGARTIVEAALPDFKVAPSQGTHFLQNLTSLGVGYFTVDAATGDGMVDWPWLAAQPEITATEYVRHIRTERALKVRIEGQTGRGIILPPTEPAESRPQSEHPAHLPEPEQPQRGEPRERAEP